MKHPISLSNYNLIKLSSDLLERGTSIRFCAKGFSMRPFIQDGDLIIVSPLRNSSVRVGGVVLYKTADNRAIVHRVIRKARIDGKAAFFIKGDAAFGPPEKIGMKNILGRIVAVERNGRERKSDTKLYRIIGLFLAGLSPFSRWIYPPLRKIKHRINKIKNRYATRRPVNTILCKAKF